MRLFPRKDTHQRPADRFTRIVNPYRQPIYWFVRRRVVSHQDADDVVQEVFIRAFRNIETLRDDSAIRPWLYRIAVNETNRFLTSRYQSEAELTEELSQHLTQGEYVDYDNAMAVTFQKALLTLSEKQRTVFELRYYNEMPYEEISRICDTSVATLKTTYHIARQKVTDYILNNQ
ncbi:MAG: RNA polymerase sigma factor [Muribaculaceae bacterium]|nr:RNA polymerase sigma factor [Muribaculaceae bacterium]